MLAKRDKNRTIEEFFYELVSEYGALEVKQIQRYFSFENELMQRIIKSLHKKGRLAFDSDKQILKAHEKKTVSERLIKCFWLVLDLLDDVEFHYAGTFPVMITIYGNHSLYEVFYCKKGDELALTHIIEHEREDSDSRVMIVIEEESQMQSISVENVMFCLINEEGEVSYYEQCINQ